MLVTQNRPRVLNWHHAGPLLFGDWGTSRLYVLGLAFYYIGHASAMYLAVMSVVMAAVAWAYTVVCRCFPEGGGVYAAARRINPWLATVGATLLLCDYIVTCALSAVEAYHYFGVPHDLVVPLCLITIAGVGVLNWLGARSAGRFALLIAVLAIGSSAAIAVLCLPLVPAGLRAVSWETPGIDSWWERWESLVRIVLALSGVEAVANMTGLMREPVARTARRTIWPVLLEVVALNLLFGIALAALPGLAERTVPDYVAYEIAGGVSSEHVPAEVRAYRDTAMKSLAIHAGQNALGERAGYAFGIATATVFAALLLSAVNTAVMAMVSVMYSMAHDGELPRRLTRLNYSGVPWVGLLIACAVPMALLAIEADVKALGELYAIGVVGAITINLLSCAANRELPIRPWERRGLWGLGAVMALIELTIIVAKPNATIFAGVIVGVVLAIRIGLRAAAGPRTVEVPIPEAGWLSELERAPLEIGPGQPRIMLAARGTGPAAYAVELARERRAALFAIYVRTLRLMDVAPGSAPKLADDPDAQASLGATAVLARQHGVPFVPIYVTSDSIAEEILDYAVTFGCDTVILGKSRRSAFARAVEGDVIAQVARHLPAGVSLITREAAPYLAAPEVPAARGSPAPSGE